MKNPAHLFLPLLFAIASPLAAQQATAPAANASLKNEITESYRKASQFLLSQQNKEGGYWSEEENPAITAIALSALLGDPTRDPAAPVSDAIKAGFTYLRSKVQPDGGIYTKSLATYNTSLSLMAFLALGDPADEQLMLNARKFLVGQQQDYDTKGVTDNEMDGGVGYGGSSPHSDLSNTTFALEALYYSKKLLADKGKPEESQNVDWDAAITFVSRCQNHPSTSGAWASNDPKNAGGFVYYPGNSKAGEDKLENGKVALRSYGSMTYAGLLSFIYAGMDASDPRIEALMQWLGKNYTLDENPGLGHEGVYYYYQTMSKGLSIAGVDKLKLADGTMADWRSDLTRRYVNNQQSDGSWKNTEAARWKEGDPVLVTGYSLLGLGHIYRGL